VLRSFLAREEVHTMVGRGELTYLYEVSQVSVISLTFPFGAQAPGFSHGESAFRIVRAA
jgi:hypothetical protein